MRTLEEIEAALDSGNLEIGMKNGRWWTARRNGKTKRWVRHPERFRIPFKVGLKTCGQFEQDWLSYEGNTWRIKK